MFVGIIKLLQHEKIGVSERIDINKSNKSYREINIKNRPYYFFNDMLNIKNFETNLLVIDKISFKSTDIDIYYIEYIIMKSLNHVNIHSQNPLYLIINVDGYIEKSSGNKNWIFASTDKKKEVLKKYAELWDEIKNQIKTRKGGEPIKYKKDFMKIRFE